MTSVPSRADVRLYRLARMSFDTKMPAMRHGWVFAFVTFIAAACGGRVTDDCQFCGQKCVDTATDVYDCGGCGQTCSVGQSCVAGKCTNGDTSSSGSTNCNDPSVVDCGDGVCSNLVNDAKNCGACGFDCGGGVCKNGVCTPTGSCVADHAACALDADCCSDFCASDGLCGCVATGSVGCALDVDCCSPSVACNANGVCE